MLESRSNPADSFSKGGIMVVCPPKTVAKPVSPTRGCPLGWRAAQGLPAWKMQNGSPDLTIKQTLFNQESRWTEQKDLGFKFRWKHRSIHPANLGHKIQSSTWDPGHQVDLRSGVKIEFTLQHRHWIHPFFCEKPGFSCLLVRLTSFQANARHIFFVKISEFYADHYQTRNVTTCGLCLLQLQSSPTWNPRDKCIDLLYRGHAPGRQTLNISQILLGEIIVLRHQSLGKLVSDPQVASYKIRQGKVVLCSISVWALALPPPLVF